MVFFFKSEIYIRRFEYNRSVFKCSFLNDWIMLAWSKVVYKKKKTGVRILPGSQLNIVIAIFVLNMYLCWFVYYRLNICLLLWNNSKKSIKTKLDNIRWDYKSLTFVTPDYTTWSHSQPVFSLRYRRYCIFVSLLYAFLFLFIFLRALPCFFNFFTASE